VWIALVIELRCSWNNGALDDSSESFGECVKDFLNNPSITGPSFGVWGRWNSDVCEINMANNILKRSSSCRVVDEEFMRI
jgi:hypothetical protein